MIRHPSSRSKRLGPLGLGGRDPLADALGRRLDDDWHWLHRAAPGGGEPIDAILVGPGGAWTLSMAGERGRFARRNGHWYRWNRATESWVPWDAAPITAARLASRRLGLYLERAALPPDVHAVLVPPRGMSLKIDRHDTVGVLVDDDPDRLARAVLADDVLTRQQVDRIVALLDPRQPLPRLAPSTPHG